MISLLNIIIITVLLPEAYKGQGFGGERERERGVCELCEEDLVGLERSSCWILW